MVNISAQTRNGDDYYNYYQNSINISSLETNMKMPSESEILSAFELALKEMDLPPDKMRTLRDCDLKKKWDLVCDQRRMHEMQTVTDPSVYLEKLAIYLDKKQFKKKKKLLGGETSTSILKHIEISLRTNSIDWVCQFLSTENNGLKILVEYLSQIQDSYVEQFGYEDLPSTSSSTSSYVTTLNQAQSTQLHAPNQNGEQFSFDLTQQKYTGNSCKSYHFMNNNNNNNNLNGTFSMIGNTSFFDDGTNSMTGSLNTIVTNKPQASNSIIFNKSNNVLSCNSTLNSTKISTKISKQHQNLNYDTIEDNVHVCVACLRALMNNKFGFNQVFNNKKAIYCIVRSIRHQSLRTKASAIELLAAICMFNDGHELIIDAFNRFRMEYNECLRFQSLFNYLVHQPEFHIDFTTSCIKFINVIVHSTEDRNQRVALQYEFTSLGLDQYLENLLHDNIDDALATHIYSYLNNMIDVQNLIDESNDRLVLLDKVTRLEQDNSVQREHVQEVEADYIARNALLNKRLADLVTEKDCLEKEKNKKDLTIHTLTRDFKEREQKYEKEKATLESRIQELERTQHEIQEGLKLAQRTNQLFIKSTASSAVNNTTITTNKSTLSTSNSTSIPPAPPPLPTNLFKAKKNSIANSVTSSITSSVTTKTLSTPPPPLPPNFFAKNSVVSAPPPPPAFLHQPAKKASIFNNEPAVSKKIAVTKHKLPMFNWSALNPNQVKGTVFNDLNDEKLVDVLDLSFLEQMFKVGNSGNDNLLIKHEMSSSTSTNATNSSDQPQISPRSSHSSIVPNNGTKEQISFLSTKRLQNVAITRRKLAKSVTEIMTAVHRFDLSVLTQENVDILLPIVPTNEEIQQYKEYASKNNSLENLTLEDQFLAQLMNIERLTQKLNILSFMAGFEESYNLLVPQIQKVTAASKSIREATSFHKIIEVILAVGNAMNGTRRAPVYGFKLSSLDSLVILKSQRDRSITMMHVIAEIVATTFPNLLDVIEQLKFAEGAAGVNMDTINADVRDIEAKYAKAIAEKERKGNEACPQALCQFLQSTQPKIQILREGLKLAQDAFIECAEYYGEPSRGIHADAFFTRITTFIKHFDQALNENELRKTAEQRQAAEQERKSVQQIRRQNTQNLRDTQNKLVDELNVKFLQSLSQGAGDSVHVKGKSQLAKKSAKLDSSQINDGDFERIMNGLKDGFVAVDTPLPVPIKRRVGANKTPSPNRLSRSSNSNSNNNSAVVTHEVARDRN